MKGVVVLVLLMMDMESAVFGLTINNSSVAVASPAVSGSLWEPQALSRSKRDGGATALAIVAISSLLAAASVGTAVGITVDKIEGNQNYKYYLRNFKMTVRNNLRLDLSNAKSALWYGWISSPPVKINPSSLIIITGHKKGHSATGTSGIVSWKIPEKDLTAIVFWSVPYSGCNSMGLGLYKGLSPAEPSYSKRHDYFNDLYRYSNYEKVVYKSWGSYPKTLRFKYVCGGTTELCTANDGIQMTGTISTDSAAIISVTIDTTSWDTCYQ